MSTASADPNTEAPPLTAQAHGTSSFDSAPARLTPVANGMPMSRPSGAISATVTTMREDVDAPSIALVTCGRSHAYKTNAPQAGRALAEAPRA